MDISVFRNGAAVLAMLVSATPLVGQPPADSFPPGVTVALVERGRGVFEGVGGCFNCHGADAHGLLGPNLTDGNWRHAKGSYLAILGVILDGVPASASTNGIAMPARGGSTINEDEVQAVAAYVWHLTHRTTSDSLPPGVNLEMIDRGKNLFQGEARCSACHGPTAHGAIGPDLTDGTWLHAKGGYLEILHQVLTGVSEEESLSGLVMPPRGGADITDAQVYAVAAYVWYLSR